MNRSERIITDMSRLVELFQSRCSERSTLDALHQALSDRAKWAKARGLFDRIRAKSLTAHRNNDGQLVTQYMFEEVCAKTLLNLSGASAPFDADSPYWIIPSALELARNLQIDTLLVLNILVAEA